MSSRILSLIRTIILARILIPEDFGVFGLSFTIVTLFETFTYSGLHEAIIQKRDETDKDLNTIWTFHILRGILLAVILYLTYRLFAYYFNEPTLNKILPFLSLYFIFKGFSNIGIIYFQKDLEFHKRFFYIISGALADVIISVGMAYILRNFWALVWSCLISEFTMMTLSYFFSPHRPKLYFNVDILKRLFKFGIWIWCLSVISFFIFRADKFIIAKIVGSSALGFYLMANKIADISAVNIGKVMGTVMFPTFSLLQKEPSRLRNSFHTTLYTITFISLPITLIVLMFTNEIVLHFLGENWLACVIPIQILTVGAFFRTVIAPCGSLLRGIGKPKIDFMLAFLRGILTFCLALIFTKFWGILGTSISALLGTAIPAAFWLLLALKAINMHPKKLLTNIKAISYGIVMMMAPLIITKCHIHNRTLIYNIVLLLIMIILYFFPSFAMWCNSRSGPIKYFYSYFIRP